MGDIEKRRKQRQKKQDIRRAVLTTVAVTGVIAVALAAPNTLQLLRFAPGMRSQYRSRTQRAIDRLVSQGYLRKVGKDNRTSVSITASGRSLLERLAVGSSRYKPPEKWDKRWRIVIFDIPERRRNLRIKLRTMLRAIGFYKLQASVWVYPYDCEDLIVLLKKDFLLGKEVAYILAEEIEGEWILKKHFGLK